MSYDFDEKESVLAYHRQLEAMKLAFADGEKYITEERKMGVTVEELLSEVLPRKLGAKI